MSFKTAVGVGVGPNFGTNEPDSALHVLGDTLKLERTDNAPALKLYNNHSSPADGAALGYVQFTGKDNDGTANMVYSEVRGGVGYNTDSAVSGYLAFLTTNNGTSVAERMRIKYDGNVGIGTDDPRNKLTITDGATSYTTANILLQIKRNASNGDDDTSKASIMLANNSNGFQIAYGGTSDRLRFIDGGAVERITLVNGGNVGIGTTSPSSRLQIKDSQDASFDSGIGITRSASSQTGYINMVGGAFNLNAPSAIPIKFRDGGTTNMTILGDGNVGIGTDNPALPLQVSDSGFGQLRLTRDSTDDRHWDFLVALNGYLAIKPNNTINTSNEYITIRDSGNNEKIRLATADDSFFVGGSVGIGTNAPTELLEVDGNIRLGDGDHRNIIGPTNATLGIYSNPNATNEGIKFSTDGGSTIEMFLQDGGKLGIGTEVPYNLLHVNGNSRINSLIVGNCAVSNTPSTALHIKSSGTDAVLRIEDLDSSNQVFDFLVDQGLGFQIIDKGTGSSTNPRLTIDTAGNVGIGTTVPGTNKLFINGNTMLDGTAYVDDALTVDGYINFDTMGDYLTFYGNANAHHSISSRNSSGVAADDIRINTYGALFINLDSNNNNTSGADFSIGRHGDTGAISDWLLDLSGETGKLRLYKYGSGTHTGTLAKSLGVDSSGNVIEFTAGTGTVTGSGTDNYVPRWNGTTALQNSSIYARDDGHVGIGTVGDGTWRLRIEGGFYANGMVQLTNTNGVAIYNSSGASRNVIELNPSDQCIINRDAGTVIPTRIVGDYIALEPTNFIGAAVEAVRVIESGNVGIGTTTPGYKLDIGGVGSSVDNTIRLNQNNGGTAIRIGAGGGSSDVTLLRVDGESSAGNHDGATDSSEYGFSLRYMGARSGNANSLSIFSDNQTAASQTEAVTIYQDGNVGIGTTSPGGLLEVGSDGNTDYALIGPTKIGGGFGHGDYAGFSHRDRSTTTSYALLQHTAGTTYLNSNVRIYMGVNNANYTAQVESDRFQVNNTLKLNDNSKIKIGSSDDLEIYHNGSDSFISDVGTGNLVISGSGVWIKNAAINANMIGCVEGSGGYVKLYQNGNEKLATTSAGVTVTGTLTETSSIAIKENVETYTPSLDIINKIRPVKYNRKENKKKKEIGLIAEELAELFPELVEKDEKGNPSSVNYSRAVTVLLGGFKELYKEVQELKKRI